MYTRKRRRARRSVSRVNGGATAIGPRCAGFSR